MSTAFRHHATLSASTRRATVSGGKRTSPIANLTGIVCTPLDVVEDEVARRAGLETPHRLLQTFVDAGLDVRAGDLLVVGSEAYPVRAAAAWEWRGASFLHLIVEELQS